MKNLNLNLPKVIAAHVVGKDHSQRHHMIAGVFVMAVGVAVAKSAMLFDFVLWHYGVDLVGYAIHGIGLTPFVESLLRAEGAE